MSENPHEADPGPVSPPAWTHQYSPVLMIHSAGSQAVGTDAVLAEAQGLHTVSDRAVPLSSRLNAASSLVGMEQLGMLCSRDANSASDAIVRARSHLLEVSVRAGDLAAALDTAALNYGLAEDAALDKFVTLVEGVAGGLAFISLLTSPALWINALFGSWIAGLAMNEGDDPVSPESVAALPSGLSDPFTLAMMRMLIMAVDDAAGGGLRYLTDSELSDLGYSALVITLLGQFGGLFVSSPVHVEKTETRANVTPGSGVEDHALAIPSPIDGDRAQIRIDVISEAGKQDRYEVYIGGTVDFGLLAQGEPFDMTSNLAMLAGLPAGAYDGIKQAMADAGISKDSPVTFTGHSQGGLIAARLAESGEYNTKALLTFGAPTGQVLTPAGLPNLVVEHLEDLVPVLGGVQNNPNATVVSTRAYETQEDVPTDIAIPAHRIDQYAETGRAIDQTGRSAEITEVLDTLDSFAGGEVEVTSLYYQVSRDD